MFALVALILSQPLNLNEQPIIVRDEGVKKGASAKTIDCVGVGVTCSKDGGTMYIGVIAGAGGGTIVDGGYVSATTATGIFYVNVDGGSDSNDCMDAGAPCLTLGGALNKLPLFIQNTQTINVGPGTYTEAVSVSKILSANVSIVGPAFASATVASGSATGAITAIDNTSFPAVITDSTQSWTVNDLRGKYFVMTNGAQTAQVRAIASNTATTVTLASGYTTPPVVAGTYAIQTATATLTSTTSATATVRLLGMGSSTFTISNLDIVTSLSSGTACVLSASGASVIALTQVKCWANSGSTSVGLQWNGGGSLSVGSASAASIVIGGGRGLQLASASTTQPIGGGCRLQPAHTYVYGGASAVSLEQYPGAISLSLSGGVTFQTNSTTATDAAFRLQVPIYAISQTSFPIILQCLQGGPSGLLVDSPATAAVNVQAVRGSLASVVTRGCSSGLNLVDPSATLFVINRLDCGETSGSCTRVLEGSRLRLPSTFNTDAGTDISIDGTTYTKSDLTSASPTRITNTATGSSVWQ